MKITARKAVSPIIATLLLIAIAVAAGIIVYVYTNSLAGGLTQGGGQQVSDQISMDAYSYVTPSSGVTITIRDTGSSSVTVNSIFFDGTLAGTLGAASGTCSSPATTSPYGTCTTGQTLTITLTTSPAGVESAASGTSHAIKIITATGGTAVFTVVAGRTG
ncbi:MAG TPA: archaellin/type IV pilin N-terminal domain-containing protein [Nitrososphaerales archaeon]|nr:archaellin/type IV pilin N-terminal domain-containing protein [Nitrososphaerales archaeon]